MGSKPPKIGEYFLQPIILASFSEFPSVEVKLGEQLEPVSKLGPHSAPTRLPNALQPVKSYHFQLFPFFPSFILSVVRHLTAVERLQAWGHQEIKHQNKPDDHYCTRIIWEEVLKKHFPCFTNPCSRSNSFGQGMKIYGHASVCIPLCLMPQTWGISSVFLCFLRKNWEPDIETMFSFCNSMEYFQTILRLGAVVPAWPSLSEWEWH